MIALRANLVATDPLSGNDVPFYYQPTLGGSQDLRGLEEYRFRDRNRFLLSAEYRWQVWWAAFMAGFVDMGTVAFELDDLDLADLEVRYGFGLRVHSNITSILRFDLAFGNGRVVPILRFDHVF